MMAKPALAQVCKVLGCSVQPMRGSDSIMWTIKFRNGTMKRFKFPIRTTAEGSIDLGARSGSLRIVADKATGRMQEIYSEPIKPELITERLRHVREAGITVASTAHVHQAAGMISVQLGVDIAEALLRMPGRVFDVSRPAVVTRQ